MAGVTDGCESWGHSRGAEQDSEIHRVGSATSEVSSTMVTPPVTPMVMHIEPFGLFVTPAPNPKG